MEHLIERLPEVERAVADGNFRRNCQPARLRPLNFDSLDPRLNCPRYRMAVAHNPTPAVGETKVGVFGRKRLEFRFDRLRDQPASALSAKPRSTDR